MYRAGLPVHVVHQQILAQSHRSRKVGFAFAELSDLPYEIHKSRVGCEHESVDQNTLPLAAADFFHGSADYQWIEAKGVFVDAAVIEG
jgi:hypothetical protein